MATNPSPASQETYDATSEGKRLSEESVIKGTGFGWAHWFNILDDFSAKEKSHKEIAAWLLANHNITQWWAQGVTTHYELEHGLREFRQRSKGYGTSVSRTISTTLQKAWDAWADPKVLSQWFTTNAEQEFVVGGRYSNGDGDSGMYKCITPLKHIRFTWESKHHEQGSDVVLEFRERDDGKVRIELTHEKLKSKKDADDLKEGWSWAMDCLKLYLETGSKIQFEEWQFQKAGKI